MIDQLIRKMAQKAPAATMFRALFERVFSEDSLEQIFRDHRQAQLESTILFSHLVGMLTGVVTGASKSVHASHQASEYPYSRQALYDKLRGVESPVSSALLRVSTHELLKVRSTFKMTRKDVIPGFHTYVIDGKSYNATEHRLLETRDDARAPLPGRAIALLDMRYEMFVDIECDLNAHRCERKIAEPLLERCLEPGALYIADRNFSDGVILGAIHRGGAYYIIRKHGACPSWREIPGEKRKIASRNEEGNKIFEQAIEVRLDDESWCRVRRVTVELTTPTRNGDMEIHLLTNLPKKVRAKKIAAAYRERWTIENCFGHLTRAFNAEIKSLCYPQAAGLCFSLTLLLFNLTSFVRTMLLEHGQYSDRYVITDVSYYYLADEIDRYYFAMEELVDASQWRIFGTMSLAAFKRFMKKTAQGAQLRKYRKHVRGPTKNPTGPRKFTGARHVATQTILEARKC